MNLDLTVERGDEVPLGTQLAWKLRGLVQSGRLSPGDRLPSLRDAAGMAGVNVNTMRAVYAKLEAEGLLRSEQGRGTFVAERAGEAETRRELRREITRLEAELARHPPPPLAEVERPASPALLSATDLASVRDGLLERLRVLDSQRAELLIRLEQLAPEPSREQRQPPRSSSPSRVGARIRWAGA